MVALTVSSPRGDDNEVHHGCKDVRCRTPTCFTTRIRECRKINRAPLRRYTEISALAIAFTLASSPNAPKMLCPYVADAQLTSLGLPRSTEIDHKSLMQQVCCSVAVGRFLQSNEPKHDQSSPQKNGFILDSKQRQQPAVMPKCVWEARQSIELRDLEDIDTFFSSNTTVVNGALEKGTTAEVNEVREYLCQVLSSPTRLLESFSESIFTRKGRTSEIDAEVMFSRLESIAEIHKVPIFDCLRRCLLRHVRSSHQDGLCRLVVICFYSLGIIRPRKLIQEAAQELGSKTALQRMVSLCGLMEGRRLGLFVSIAEIFSRSLRDGTGDDLIKQTMSCLCLKDVLPTFSTMVWRMALWVAFLQHAFKMKWDGFPLIHVDSATGHILEVLQALVEKDWTDARFEDGESFGVHWVNFASELRRLGGYAIAAVCKHLDVEAACHVWLNHSPNPAYRHIFTYQFLFTKYDHWQFFRTACHSHMRQAVKGASFVQYARQRIFPFLIQKDGKYLDRRLKTVQESYLVLKISRKNVIRDALDQLWQRESRQLHKPLRVSLGTGEGEMGQDLGGVQIEFFNLLCRELFEGDRPLFTTDAATQLSWFGVGSLEPLHRYELVGVLFGLAIYNGITLPVSFPSALYKKLMGYRTDRNDLREGWPEVHKSLQDIEDYTDDVETDLALEQTYTIRANGLDLSIDSRYYGFDYYNPEIPQERKARVQVYWAQSDKDKMKNGTSRVVEADGEEDSTKGEEEPDVENLFWPGWEFTMAPSDESPLPVTNENRSEYIKQYATWLLDYSIRPQFYAFACGFYEVLDPRTMRILAPESLRELVEGRSHIDIEDLKRLITYEGYTAESEQIKWFWAILDEYDQEKLRLLLEFVTGSKRMPASGQRSLRFNITRIDGDSESLPGASTCFGNLLLPEYSSKEKMEKKLGIALEHSLGFGQA